MTRLESYLNVGGVDYPEEISLIRASSPLLKDLPSALIDRMWRDFSDKSCAGFLIPDPPYLKEFEEWLEDSE